MHLPCPAPEHPHGFIHPGVVDEPVFILLSNVCAAASALPSLAAFPSAREVQAAAVASCCEDAQGWRRHIRSCGGVQRWDHHIMARRMLVHCIRVHCCLTGLGMHCRRLLCAAPCSGDKFCLYSVRGVHHLQVSSAQVLMGEALKLLRYEWDIGGPFCDMDKVAL